MITADQLPGFLRKHFAGRDTLRRAFDNSSWLVCDQVLRMIAGLAVGIWMARYLGPERYGWLSYALAVVGLVSSFTSLGVNAVLVRELVKTPAETEAWMGTAFFIKSASASVGFLAGVRRRWRGCNPCRRTPCGR